MTEFTYNVNNLNSENGTAHIIEEWNGTMVKTACGLSLRPLKVYDTEDGDEPTGKCGNCSWGGN